MRTRHASTAVRCTPDENYVDFDAVVMYGDGVDFGCDLCKGAIRQGKESWERLVQGTRDAGQRSPDLGYRKPHKKRTMRV